MSERGLPLPGGADAALRRAESSSGAPPRLAVDPCSCGSRRLRWRSDPLRPDARVAVCASCSSDLRLDFRGGILLQW